MRAQVKNTPASDALAIEGIAGQFAMQPLHQHLAGGQTRQRVVGGRVPRAIDPVTQAIDL
jgi:predicted DNA-binding protein with PD1-like motif